MDVLASTSAPSFHNNSSSTATTSLSMTSYYCLEIHLRKGEHQEYLFQAIGNILGKKYKYVSHRLWERYMFQNKWVIIGYFHSLVDAAAAREDISELLIGELNAYVCLSPDTPTSCFNSNNSNNLAVASPLSSSPPSSLRYCSSADELYKGLKHSLSCHIPIYKPGLPRRKSDPDNSALEIHRARSGDNLNRPKSWKQSLENLGGGHNVKNRMNRSSSATFSCRPETTGNVNSQNNNNNNSHNSNNNNRLSVSPPSSTYSPSSASISQRKNTLRFLATNTGQFECQDIKSYAFSDFLQALTDTDLKPHIGSDYSSVQLSKTPTISKESIKSRLTFIASEYDNAYNNFPSSSSRTELMSNSGDEVGSPKNGEETKKISSRQAGTRSRNTSRGRKKFTKNDLSLSNATSPTTSTPPLSPLSPSNAVFSSSVPLTYAAVVSPRSPTSSHFPLKTSSSHHHQQTTTTRVLSPLSPRFHRDLSSFPPSSTSS